MGERKGQNFYYPPDFDYKTHGSLNRYHGTHALRERAKKVDQGILIIRFEMPFNIWCLGCHNHVGMGVRYNAEKKKVGMYYTTPLYEFRMKCHLCDNYYVIRTDPKNFDYELTEGCSRQEIRYDPTTIDHFAAVDRTFNAKLAADAMFKAEHEHKDKTTAESDEGRMDKIEWVQERLRDDFAANQALRSRFRREKQDLTEKRARDNDLLTRSSLSIRLAPEDPNDQKVAAMLTRYKTVKSFDDRKDEERAAITSRRIFASTPSTSSSAAAVPEPTTSIERLKQNLKLERNKRINEQFDFGGAPTKIGRASLNLGIVRKVKSETSSAEAGEGPLPIVATSMKDEDVIDIKDEKNVEARYKAAPLLVADYGSSSDSD